MDRFGSRWWAIGIAVWVAGPVFAQRYELGQRLRMMERAWDSATPAQRAAAVDPLKKAVTFFFSGKVSDAAAALDSARLRLQGVTEPTARQRWANALAARPAARLVDPADPPIPIELTTLYDPGTPAPEEAALRLVLVQPEGRTTLAEWPIEKLPVKGELDLTKMPPGDYQILAEIRIGDRTEAQYPFLISVAPKFRERWMALRDSAKIDGDAPTTDQRTLKSLLATIQYLAERYELETDYPAERLLREAEALAESLKNGQEHYTPARSGEHWLTLSTSGGPAMVRVFVPKDLKPDAPTPLVVAMHGAGGSENLFFDGYGDGAAVRSCKDRGWLMVAPRAGGILGGAPPVAAIVDELARLYPVDRQRVYLVGHSMGAAQAIAALQAAPGRFAAAAALGGGGSVRKPEAVKTVPIFVGCGEQDFALGGARGLVRALEQAGAAVTYKPYADVEHLAIVQAAIPEVFAFFDRQGRQRPNQ